MSELRMLAPQNRPTFEALVDRHRVGVWRYLRLLGCPADLADDLTQETFLAAWRQPPFDWRGDASAAGFLRTVARNRYVSQLRRDARFGARRVDLDAAEQVWDEVCGPDDGAEYFSAVAKCLSELAPRARRAVVAAHIEGTPRGELAAELGLQNAGLKTLLARAVRALRECVNRRMTR